MVKKTHFFQLEVKTELIFLKKETHTTEEITVPKRMCPTP